MFGLAASSTDISLNAHSRPVPAIHRQMAVAEGGALPYFGGSGTGGIESVHFIMSRQGYSPFVIVKAEQALTQNPYTPYTDLMKEVKTGFGRTMTYLPAVFGVSRQTLYNWLNGETPKEQHKDKLVQLAAAAHVFNESGFKPTASSLERIVAQGKSFVELIGEGANGKEMAERLLRIEKRGTVAREKLDALLGERMIPRPEIADMGRPTFNEDV